MKKRINKNKNCKYSILKIHKESDDILMSKEIKSIKITSHNIINSIDNLEYLEGTNLNKHLTEDKLLLKYENEIKDNKNPIARSDGYKKVIRYLKDNDISDMIIYDNKSLIIGYLRDNNDINLETLKNAILKNDKIYKKEHCENRDKNIIKTSTTVRPNQIW